MRISLAIGLIALALPGCTWGPPPGAMPPSQLATLAYDNPVLVPLADHQYVWETIVSVVNAYFRIEREEPVRLIGNTLIEGRIDTFWEVSPTIFEPWREDAANDEQFVENTLQTLRRKATIRVIPTQGGFWVEVTVLKELEDLKEPENATAGAATLRYDNTLTRVINPLVGEELNRGWISQGRDAALEQRILGHVQSRLGGFAPRLQPQPAGPAVPSPIAYPACTGG